MPSPFQVHQAKWTNCRRCHLAERRSQVVLCKGKLPCDILFCGEAPGASEDTFGFPFAGPAGHLFDQITGAVIPEWIRLAYTNLVACIPLGPDWVKVSEPPAECIKACAPRLIEFVNLAKPKAVVFVGDLAQKHFPSTYPFKIPTGIPDFAHIVHPAAILRATVAMQSIMRQRCKVTLQGLIDRLTGGVEGDIPF